MLSSSSSSTTQRREGDRGVPRGLRWYDRLTYRLCASRTFDGLWLGSLGAAGSLDRLEAALTLIRDHDAIRYRRLLADVDRVVVRTLAGALGEYNERTRACELDTRFVLQAETTAAQIAVVLVHEAAHARLARLGFTYAEHRRERIERLCLRREAAFARKLPGASTSAGPLEPPPACLRYTNDELEAHRLDGAVEALHHLGWPNWLIAAVVAVRRWRKRRGGA